MKKKKEQKTPEEKAICSCIELCKNYGGDLSKGQCLSENILEDSVCDSACNPGEEADNDPENQSKACREGKAYHFVEVDSGCGLIKAI